MYWALLMLVLGNMAFFALHLKPESDAAPRFLPPLTKQQEQQYFADFAAGDQKAREKLILHNLRLVAHVCKKYRQDDKIEAEDMVSIGTIGLIKAVDTYSCDRRTAFSTYAARCVENEILMQYRKLKKYEGTSLLSDTLQGEDDSLTYLDTAAADDDIAQMAELRQDAQKLHKLICSCLTPRERIIVTLRYGIDGGRTHTQSQVGQKLGISRSYVSRIEKKALQKLKTGFEK